MNDDVRRNEIQRLADRHQYICQQHVDFGRVLQARDYKMSPELQSQLEQLIEAEKTARAEFNAARAGWYETVYVKPVR